MNALDQLNSYLKRLESRLRLLAFSKGTSLVTLSALLSTVLLVWIINRYAFSPASLLWARILLFLSVATAIAFGLIIPLLQMNRRNAARRAERSFPDFQERLLTLARTIAFVQRLHSPGSRPATTQFKALITTLLENDVSFIPDLVGYFSHNAARMRLCDGTGLIRVNVALSEALSNAILHGNLELDSAGFDFFYRPSGVIGHRSGLRIGHQPPRPKHFAELAHFAHRFRGRYGDIKIGPALLTFLYHVLEADVFRAGRLGGLG